MSENKQTLFRFRTMRAPKEREIADLYLIHYPSILADNDFYEAVEERDPGQSVMDALVEKASTFTPLNKVGIQDLNGELLELGDLLLRNRDTITYAQVETAIGIIGDDVLTTENRELAWNNLFYQTITMESVAVRETILKLLIGHTMAVQFEFLPETDAAVRRIANARVVLPSLIFLSQEDYGQATTTTSPVMNTLLLQKHMNNAENQVKIAIANTAIKDLDKYRKEFYQKELPPEMEANKTYQKNVGIAISSAESTLETDPVTGKLTKRINPTLPSYTFVPTPEVDMDALEGAMTNETMALIENLGLTTCHSFEQIEMGLRDYVNDLQNDVFSKTDFNVDKLSVNGTLISRCSLDSRYNPEFSYLIRGYNTFDDYYHLLLCVDTGSSCIKLDSVNIYYGENELEEFTFSNKDGIVTIDLAPTGRLRITEEVDLSGTLVFNNGLVLTLNSDPFSGDELKGICLPSHNHMSQASVYIPSGFGMRSLGIADFRKIEQSICCYVPGEVSHIENVMAREYKERSTRRLRRSEDTTTQSSSREKEHMTDTTSTSRYEMQHEISQVIQESHDFSSDVNLNASVSGTAKLPLLGESTVSASSGFSSNYSSSTSQEHSDNQAVTFAKEVTEKALDRVVSKVSEERIRKIVEEFEEQNRHGFDNRKGGEHISGVYRWVDKVYKNQVVNYGKRLHYEFMIPEPASFHLMSKHALSESGIESPVVKPLDPRKPNFGPLPAITHASLVDESNYLQWAAVYGAEVSPPPDSTLTVAKSVLKPNDGSAYYESRVVNEEVNLPEGYSIRRIYISAYGNGDQPTNTWERFYVTVGGTPRIYWNSVTEHLLHADSSSYPELERFSGSVPFTVQFTGLDGGMVSAEIELLRRPSHFAAWQLETFNAIVTAYEDRLAEYNSDKAEQEVQSAQLMATNPNYLRRIENTILKKNCIAYMIGHLNMGKDFVSGTTAPGSYVTLNANLDKYAATVKFFEQAFDWELMDYHLYPFYWGDRGNWAELYSKENDDALFRSFLQSGMARVIVSVRPGFEEAVMFYLSTGIIWNGGEMAVLGEDIYLDVVGDLTDQETIGVTETWETRIPSTLTVIQAKTIALNAEGLPCYCDEEAEEETITSVDLLPTLEVFIPGDTSGDDEEPEV